MKKIYIPAIDKWIGEKTDKTHFQLPAEAVGGVWVDIGCEVGGLIRSYPFWADKYVGYDISEVGVSSTKEYLKDNDIKGEVHKLAVAKESGKSVKVYAHYNFDEQSTDYYGNIANLSTQLGLDARGSGWKAENQVDNVKSISFADVKKECGKIDVLKVTVDNSVDILLKADISDIKWLIVDFNPADETKKELKKWIEKTHTHIHSRYFTLYKLGVKNEETSTDNSTEELEGNNSTEVSGSTK